MPHLRRLAIAICLLGAAPAAHAGDPSACADRAGVVQKLQERFGETLQSVGLQRDDAVVEVYASEATGTWTILMTRPDGSTCLLAAGQRWEDERRRLATPGSPA